MDRRRAPRFPFIAEAQVIEVSSNTKLNAQTSDISMGGCFLDMLNPCPPATDIQVIISRGSLTFSALAKVVFVTQNMGMGVVFTKIDTSQLQVLMSWLSELSSATG